MPLEYNVMLCWCLFMTDLVGAYVLYEEGVSTLGTTAVLTGVARLPCDLEPPFLEDKVVLVIWYKDGVESPIYSLDVREQVSKHWADERTLGLRAYFMVSAVPKSSFSADEGHLGSYLGLDNVREEDTGSYRCRVDFKHSPTRNSVVKLTVIVPPQNVTILDEHGVIVRGPFIGPYTEGSNARITCIAFGDPRPRVTWWHDDVIVDEIDEPLSEHRAMNVLYLKHLQRQHLHSVFTCQASNNKEVEPVSSQVSLDLHLPPLDVRLLGENLPLSAGSKYEVACQVVGSRPRPHISWWKGGLQMDTSRSTMSTDGNVTTSTLTLTPTVDDLGRDLSCRADNSHIADSAIEDTWRLVIHYSPIVSLELGSNLNSSSIREGMDVYFECKILANPEINKIIFRHNGVELQYDASAGIIFSKEILVLQSVGREESGLYSCVASNTEGDSESYPFNLDIKYEPVCSPSQQKVYGAARHEDVDVFCEVDANPPAMLFRWSFNNSAVQSMDVGTVISAPGGGRSVATYTPKVERDYGTLLCWGRNELGSQEVPCVFHVIPAGRPDPPRNCVLLNRTVSSLQVSCVRGFDGGLPQEFTLELYVAGISGEAHRRLVSNVTSRTKPEFTVTGLEPGTGYRMSVYASNVKGRSREMITLRTATLRSSHQEHRTTTTSDTELPDFPQVTPFLWVLAGVVGTLGLVGIALVTILRLRSGGCDCCYQEDEDLQSGDESPQMDHGKGLTVSLTAVKTPTTLVSEDGADNPDVVPHSNETDLPIFDCKKPSLRLCVNSKAQTFVYSNVPSYSESPHMEGFRNNTPPVRWQQMARRDMGTHLQQQVPVLRTFSAGVPSCAKRQNAETQTPLLVPHKESTV